MTNQVTIIGAGPVGLLAAATLAKNNISLRIFEKKPAVEKMSKALAIHAGTLELLEATHPILLQEFLKQGIKIKQAFFGRGEKNKFDLSLIPSKYNFILSLEQTYTENILQDYLQNLGVKVERENEMVDLKQVYNKVFAQIKNNTGENFTVESNFLIDCGGAHSTSRHLLDIPFLGEKYLGHFVMGDVKISPKYEDDSLHLINSAAGIAGILPIQNDFVRLILSPFSLELDKEISFEHFKEIAKTLIPEIEITQYSWLTDIQVHKRLAAKFKVGRVFLAGDAAHIHSPVGGQGMNLGMQDALNLTYKMHKVFTHQESVLILEDYERERKRVVKEVLRLTDHAMKSGIDNKMSDKISKFLAEFIAKIFFKSNFLQKRLAITISQIKSARREIRRINA